MPATHPITKRKLPIMINRFLPKMSPNLPPTITKHANERPPALMIQLAPKRPTLNSRCMDGRATLIEVMSKATKKESKQIKKDEAPKK